MQFIVWAILTAFIAGGVTVTILMWDRAHQPKLPPGDPDPRDLEKRLADIEERLEFAERLLAQDREKQKLNP